MADTSTAKEPSGSAFGFLGHKLFGKVPVWVVAVAAIGGYYWYTRYGPGKSSSSAAAQQTDPAGNTGTIDPSTGYVYGSPEDVASLASAGNTDSSGGGGDSSGGSGGGTSTGGGTTATPPSPAPKPPPVQVHKPPGVGAAGESTRPVPPVKRKVPVKVPPRPKTSGARTVTVQRGQTLAEIAKANHISVTELAHANKYVAGEASPDKVGQTLGTGAGLKTGQVLTIPK